MTPPLSWKLVGSSSSLAHCDAVLKGGVHTIIPDSFNLKAAVEREKAVQAIDVHRECKNCVVTFWVMSQLFHFLGASRGCADFRDPTAVFRLIHTFNMFHF
jgi:hypothetical protein